MASAVAMQDGRQPPADAVSLRRIVLSLASIVHQELSILTDLLPSKVDEDRRDDIFQFLSRTRSRVMRVLVIVRWAQAQKAVKVKGVDDLAQQADSIRSIADALYGQNMKLQNTSTRAFPVGSAADILVARTYNRLPASIKSVVVPKPDVQSTAKALAWLERHIRLRIVDEVIPSDMEFGIRAGRLWITCPHLFSISLTLRGPAPSDPWRLLSLDILVTDVTQQGSSHPSPSSKALLSVDQIAALHERAEYRLRKHAQAGTTWALADICGILKGFSVSLQLDVLRSQAQFLTHIWPDLRVEKQGEHYLAISYWPKCAEGKPASRADLASAGFVHPCVLGVSAVKGRTAHGSVSRAPVAVAPTSQSVTPASARDLPTSANTTASSQHPTSDTIVSDTQLRVHHWPTLRKGMARQPVTLTVDPANLNVQTLLAAAMKCMASQRLAYVFDRLQNDAQHRARNLFGNVSFECQLDVDTERPGHSEPRILVRINLDGQEVSNGQLSGSILDRLNWPGILSTEPMEASLSVSRESGFFICRSTNAWMDQPCHVCESSLNRAPSEATDAFVSLIRGTMLNVIAELALASQLFVRRKLPIQGLPNNEDVLYLEFPNFPPWFLEVTVDDHGQLAFGLILAKALYPPQQAPATSAALNNLMEGDDEEVMQQALTPYTPFSAFSEAIGSLTPAASVFASQTPASAPPPSVEAASAISNSTPLSQWSMTPGLATGASSQANALLRDAASISKSVHALVDSSDASANGSSAGLSSAKEAITKSAALHLSPEEEDLHLRRPHLVTSGAAIGIGHIDPSYSLLPQLKFVSILPIKLEDKCDNLTIHSMLESLQSATTLCKKHIALAFLVNQLQESQLHYVVHEHEDSKASAAPPAVRVFNWPGHHDSSVLWVQHMTAYTRDSEGRFEVQLGNDASKVFDGTADDSKRRQYRQKPLPNRTWTYLPTERVLVLPFSQLQCCVKSFLHSWTALLRLLDVSDRALSVKEHVLPRNFPFDVACDGHSVTLRYASNELKICFDATQSRFTVHMPEDNPHMLVEDHLETLLNSSRGVSALMSAVVLSLEPLKHILEATRSSLGSFTFQPQSAVRGQLTIQNHLLDISLCPREVVALRLKDPETPLGSSNELEMFFKGIRDISVYMHVEQRLRLLLADHSLFSKALEPASIGYNVTDPDAMNVSQGNNLDGPRLGLFLRFLRLRLGMARMADSHKPISTTKDDKETPEFVMENVVEGVRTMRLTLENWTQPKLSLKSAEDSWISDDETKLWLRYFDARVARHQEPRAAGAFCLQLYSLPLALLKDVTDLLKLEFDSAKPGFHLLPVTVVMERTLVYRGPKQPAIYFDRTAAKPLLHLVLQFPLPPSASRLGPADQPCCVGVMFDPSTGEIWSWPSDRKANKSRKSKGAASLPPEEQRLLSMMENAQRALASEASDGQAPQVALSRIVSRVLTELSS